MKRVRWYIGIRPDRTAGLFKNDTMPTRKTHGHLYLFVFGHFWTKRAAIDGAHYQNYWKVTEA